MSGVARLKPWHGIVLLGVVLLGVGLLIFAISVNKGIRETEQGVYPDDAWAGRLQTIAVVIGGVGAVTVVAGAVWRSGTTSREGLSAADSSPTALPTPGSFCSSCGTSLTADSQFCRCCGSPTDRRAVDP